VTLSLRFKSGLCSPVLFSTSFADCPGRRPSGFFRFCFTSLHLSLLLFLKYEQQCVADVAGFPPTPFFFFRSLPALLIREFSGGSNLNIAPVATPSPGPSLFLAKSRGCVTWVVRRPLLPGGIRVVGSKRSPPQEIHSERGDQLFVRVLCVLSADLPVLFTFPFHFFRAEKSLPCFTWCGTSLRPWPLKLRSWSPP